MRVLVTGGNGFIGKYVCERLFHWGHEVKVYDLPEDVKSYFHISEAIKGVEGVIHLAGILGTSETVNNPKPSIETNILGGLNVIDSCFYKGIKCVLIGTGNWWMNSPYPITKTAVCKLAFMYNRDRGAKNVVVRGFNAYGPKQKASPVRKIIPNFIIPALKGEDLIVYGSGEQKMDMIYVGDLADILVRALVVDHGNYDKEFQAGTGIAPTVNEIAQTVITLVGSRSKIVHEPVRKGEEADATVVADVETLKPLGNIKFRDFKEGLKETIEWYRMAV